MTVAGYPSESDARTAWILSRRGAKNTVSALRPYHFFTERERSASGEVEDIATVFLTNRECPWKCVMCDLWRNTTEETVPVGAIPEQIRWARAQIPPAPVLKLYNSGSFFDRAAIPLEDRDEIARCCADFKRLIVESHPALIGAAALDFASRLLPKLEVAMGLETCHPQALDLLNKRIEPDDFLAAAQYLKSNRIDLRTFLLVNPPFIPPQEQQHWLERSIEFAFSAGSDVVSLIPTRAGNGSLEDLEASGLFREPSLSALEVGQEFGISLGMGRVFADTWDLTKFARCAACATARIERIARINLSQRMEPRVLCASCAN